MYTLAIYFKNVLNLSAFLFTLAPSLCRTVKQWVCPLAAAKESRGSPNGVVELASTPCEIVTVLLESFYILSGSSFKILYRIIKS